MGLNIKYISFINDCIEIALGELKGKTMLELGNQIIRNDVNIHESTGKEYYTNRGCIHTSIDLNGKDSSLMIDLSKPFPNKQWSNYFDIITNSGTTEHVEPKKAQYTVFKNIHDSMKVGGISVHMVPDIKELETKGKWKNHCKNYYSAEFFQMLAIENKYEIIAMKIINGLICAALRKTRDSSFMKDQYLFLSHISRKMTGVNYRGINTGRISKQIYKIVKKLKA